VAAITTAQGEVKKLVDGSLEAATKNSDLRQLNGIKALASASQSLESAKESLETAVKRTQPKAKKAKKKKEASS
jgi:hypothetical protein